MIFNSFYKVLLLNTTSLMQKGMKCTG